MYGFEPMMISLKRVTVTKGNLGFPARGPLIVKSDLESSWENYGSGGHS